LRRRAERSAQNSHPARKIHGKRMPIFARRLAFATVDQQHRRELETGKERSSPW
jgi:hypothetical protein